jgi:pilus assembly protein CpaE
MCLVDAQRGQAAVETMILLPVVVVLAVAAWQGVLIGWTAVEAQEAARQAARAALAGEPVRDAARSALPASMRDGLAVRSAGGEVTVRVSVPSIVPGFAPSVSASAAAVDG